MRDSMRMKAAVLLVGGAVAILTACGSAKTDDKTVQNGQENSQEQGGAAGQTEAGAGDLSGAAARGGMALRWFTAAAIIPALTRPWTSTEKSTF